MNNIIKILGTTSVIGGSAGYWAYNKRESALQHPVMRRALLELQKDPRVHDFCGENLRPGWRMTTNEDPVDNYITLKFNIKGSSGELGTSVIADYLTHRELTILEAERVEHFEQQTDLKS